MIKTIIIIYAIYLVLVSLFTFCVYGVDKKNAIKGRRRIPEKTLLGLSLIGGALGGLLGMAKFRHKTSLEHWYFTFLNAVGLIIHGAVIIYLITLI